MNTVKTTSLLTTSLLALSLTVSPVFAATVSSANAAALAVLSSTSEAQGFAAGKNVANTPIPSKAAVGAMKCSSSKPTYDSSTPPKATGCAITDGDGKTTTTGFDGMKPPPDPNPPKDAIAFCNGYCRGLNASIPAISQ